MVWLPRCGLLALLAVALAGLALLGSPPAPSSSQTAWRRARQAAWAEEPAATASPVAAKAPDGRAPRDPAAWGSDHVDGEVPEFVEAGECLFCHRNDVGPTWSQTDRHSQTIRDKAVDSPPIEALAKDPALKPFADEATLVMGDRRQTRFLKRGERYGHLDLLSVGAGPSRGTRYRLNHTENPHWDAKTFGAQCAGCHTTGVDPETMSFSTVPIDCFACHGDSPLEHANDAKLMLLAKERHDPPEVVTSICASCHVRFGKSKTTERPYPTNFVPGDNLFRDFEVDWSRADDPHLNPADAHVLENVRDVALYGGQQTCLSCHEVHKRTTLAHRKLPETRYCRHCHEPGKPLTEHKSYEVHSERCQY
ncbi:MAG: hypothetical protein JNG90_12040 [Planctomycetaceae bacterium]|nr:hypothetical protein [Planctomycetaceae bacterium]